MRLENRPVPGQLTADGVTSWFTEQILARGKPRKREGPPRPGAGWLYPSNAGECPRRLVLKVTEGEPPAPIVALGAGWIGDAIHEHIQALASKTLDNEDPVHEERRRIFVFPFGELWGRTDTEFTRSRLVIDWKSKSDFAFNKIKSRGTPDSREVQQVNLYLHERIETTGEEWEGGLLYINKARFEKPLGFSVTYSPKLAKKTLRGFVEVHKNLEAGTLPDRRDSPDHEDCYFCPHKEKCWPPEKNAKGKKKIGFKIKGRATKAS